MSYASDTTAPGELVVIQDLVNTADVETGVDDLMAPGGLEAFTFRRGLPPLGPDVLPALRDLREGFRAALLAHTGNHAPPERLGLLDPLLDAAPLVLRVDSAGRAALTPAPGLEGMASLTARLAAAVAVGQAAGTWERLKACEAHACQWAYYDRSPGGRRRWCSMQVCGARSKMRAYRSRQRG